MVAFSAFVTPEMKKESKQAGFDILYEGNSSMDRLKKILNLTKLRMLNFEEKVSLIL